MAEANDKGTASKERKLWSAIAVLAIWNFWLHTEVSSAGEKARFAENDARRALNLANEANERAQGRR